MKGQTSLAAAITTLQSAVNAIITTGKAELGA
jgi:hypothetical protein